MTYLLGIDFGGGASKATLLSDAGVIVCESTLEYPTLYPMAGACEQSPSDWISALVTGIRTILEKSGVAASSIAAVCIDSATHTSLICDGDMRPLRDAMHWTDTRSREQASRLREKDGALIMEKTYHMPDTIWTMPQLLYLAEQEADTFSQMRHIFFEKDYIRYFLTGEFCTDYIEAEGSMLFDCNKMAWDADLCRMAGIDVSCLPPIRAPKDSAGFVTKEAAEQTGLVQGTPVIVGTTDTAMEVFASGAIEKGDMTVKLATAGRICLITDRPYPDRHIINYSHVAEGLWYPGTATKSAAASYRYYRDTFGGDYKALDAAASLVPIGSEGLIFHPYLNGELTPYADPTLCASFTGMRATHTRAHFTRAVLEGVSLSLLDSLRYLQGLQIPSNGRATLIGGGAKGRLWQEITADALGVTLVTTESSDSSLGSAMLAGVVAGVFRDEKEAVSLCVKQKDTVTPNAEHTARYAALYEEYKALAAALAPIYRRRAQ